MSTVTRWSACFNFLFTVEPLRLLPMVVAGFWRGFVVSSFGGGLVASAGGGWIGTHNTMGCIMSVWCGIMFVLG